MASVTALGASAVKTGLRGCLRARVRQVAVSHPVHALAHAQDRPLNACPAAIRAFRTTATPCASKKPPTPSPRDTTIPHDIVQLVSPTDNSLGPPIPLASILSTYDPQTHTLTLVSSSPPIVKLVEKRAAQLKSKAVEDKARKRRARAMETSEVQVSWESARGDLEHKLALARGVLERGDRLDLVFAHKKGSKHGLLAGAKLDAARTAALELFESGIEAAGMGKQWKDPMATPSMTVRYYEPAKELRDEAVKRADQADDEKAREKERKKEERRRKEEERARRAAERAAQT